MDSKIIRYKFYCLLVKLKRNLKEDLLNEKYVSTAIYQTIIVLAILTGLEDSPPSALKIIMILIVTVLGIQVSRLYADSVAQRVVKQKGRTRDLFFSCPGFLGILVRW